LEQARDLGIHQVLDRDGQATGDLPDPGLSREEVRFFYETMVLLRAIDERGWQLQRSGRIAFWIPMRGQEALQVGATHAMDAGDWIFRAHRETASNREINLIQGSTAVGTFIPHAAGVAWAAKLKGTKEKVLCIFGDGATSRSEFHSAMNFSGIHRPPVVYLCVNNSWAVSTPLDCQTAQQNFAAKGDAYAVPNQRVDGNDPLAVYALIKAARERATEHGPTLIEAVTYRLGFHTSSDNPDLYRQEAEAGLWADWDPLRRTRMYLQAADWWSEDDEVRLHQRHAEEIQDAIDKAEAMDLPGPESQFQDVFESSNWMLDDQRDRLLSDLEGGG
jgi:TPP-dependent pyruvate/acetoin dehydrogenase alpha subunit